MADQTILQNSTFDGSKQFVMASKQNIYLPDVNNGAYNGIVMFDGTSIATNGKWNDIRNSYFALPIVMTANFGTSLSASSVENAYAMSLKNGYHHLVDRISCEIDNNQMLGLQILNNWDVHYRILSTSSQEDARNYFPSIGMSVTPDVGQATTYQVAGTCNGLGECNNRIADATASSTVTGYNNNTLFTNTGRQQRMLNTSFDPANTTGNSMLAMTSANQCVTTGRNYCTQTTTQITYYIIAIIPARILHSLFDNMPLTQGLQLKINLYTNTQFTTTLTTGGTNLGTYLGVTTTATTQTCPFMISPHGTIAGIVPANGNGLANVTTAAQTITCSIGIAKQYSTGTSTHPILSQCRWYIPVYEMCPTFEFKYKSENARKTVIFNDTYTVQYLNQAKYSQINQIVMNNVVKPRYMVIFSQIAGAVNGVSLALTSGGLIAPPLSPWSSSPATQAVYNGISNLNVLINQTALYQYPINYGYEHFLNETRSFGSLNNGMDLGMSSGVIGMNEWNNGYGYVVINLGRKLSAESDELPRSISVLFTNSNECSMDYTVIVGYEKSFIIDCANAGQLGGQN